MSEQCHICGPVKYEAPTVICAPCALIPEDPAISAHRKIAARCVAITAQMGIDFGSLVVEGLVIP